MCVSGWFMDNGGVVVWILPQGELLLRLLVAIGRTPSRLFNLHELYARTRMSLNLGDIVLHQMLVE